GLGRRDREVAPVPGRVAGAVGDVLLGLETAAVAGVDDDGTAVRDPAPVARAGALPAEPGPRTVLPHDALGGSRLGRVGDLPAGLTDGTGAAHPRGERGEGGVVGLGDRGGEDLAVGVGDDDEVAADHRQPTVVAGVGGVLDAV